MGHRVSMGNQQIVNWESGRTVAFSRVSAGRWLDREFPWREPISKLGLLIQSGDSLLRKQLT